MMGLKEDGARITGVPALQLKLLRLK